jgi:hypothetical protein
MSVIPVIGFPGAEFAGSHGDRRGRSGLCQFETARQPARQMSLHRMRVAFEQFIGGTPGAFQQRLIGIEIGETENGLSGLTRAEQLARAAQLQIFLGDDEAVGMFPDDRQPRVSRPPTSGAA